MPPIEEENSRNEVHFLEWLDAYDIHLHSVPKSEMSSNEFVISAKNLAQVAEEYSAAKKLKASDVIKALSTKQIKGTPMIFGNGYPAYPNESTYSKPSWCYTVLINNAEQYSMFYGYLGVGATEKDKQQAYEQKTAKWSKYLDVFIRAVEAAK